MKIYSKIVLKSKLRSEVDNSIDEHKADQWLLWRFYSNIVLDRQKRLRVDDMILEQTTKGYMNKGSTQIFSATGSNNLELIASSMKTCQTNN